jgi:hypothetical protein
MLLKGAARALLSPNMALGTLQFGIKSLKELSPLFAPSFATAALAVSMARFTSGLAATTSCM